MRLCRLCKKLYAGDEAVCPDDKSSTVEAALETLPEALQARFPGRVPLAQGATGTLYLVEEPGGPQRVLKVLAQDLTHDPSERARHRRELLRQQGLVHPQLTRVLEQGQDGGRVWFTREYVSATSLAVRLHQSGAFALDAAINLIVQLAAALDALHKLGLVHGDLKPGHVLLSAPHPGPHERISLQLIDATLASPLTADSAAPRGTPDYAAKEIIEGAAATFRSDLYALGCLSFELIAGVPPFRSASQPDADTAATLAAQRDAEAKSLPDIVPHAVRSVITSMLAKDARRRPFSAQQVRRSIEQLLAPAAPVRPAAHSGSLSALQREAAALRVGGSTAKPQAPVTFPDATVELDVKDLDEAIQAQAADERAKNEAQAAKASAAVDDSAPTIALTPAHVASAVPQPTAAGRAAYAANNSAGGTNPYVPFVPRETEPARADATTRTHVPLPASPAATAAESAARRTRTGTQFGLGPVRTSDVEAAALATQLQAETPAAIEPHALSADSAPVSPTAAKPNTTRARRYISTPKPLAESPLLLLWAAGGLVASIILLRIVLGPAERTRSPSIVVHVPEVATEVAAPNRLATAALSEQSLIGGNVAGAKRTPLTAARAPLAQNGALFSADEPPAVAAAAATAAEPDSVDEEPASTADRKHVPTVSAGSVKGGLVRAASNRQLAAASGTPDYKARARQLYKGGKYREAADAYQRATQHDAEDAAAFAGLGGSLLATGDIPKAIAAYQRAVRLEPEVSGFQAALGRAYLKKGDRARARAAYSKALELDPKNQAARSGMASAKAR